MGRSRTTRMITGLVTATVLAATASADEPAVYFQSHRGGVDEVPENTLAALHHSWDIPGAVPEVDLRTTKDDIIVLLHDTTLARTTNASDDMADVPIDELTLEQVRRVDAGIVFDETYAGEKVPTLEEALALLAETPDRRLYLDLKAVNLDDLGAMLEAYEVGEQVLFVHGDVAHLRHLREQFPEIPTMTWLSGSPRVIKRRFAELAQSGFNGVAQLQFHLRGEETDEGHIVYDLDEDFLKEAQTITDSAGVSLQLRPFLFTPDSMQRLMDTGVRWYVTDAPRAFYDTVTKALEARATPGA